MAAEKSNGKSMESEALKLLGRYKLQKADYKLPAIQELPRLFALLEAIDCVDRRKIAEELGEDEVAAIEKDVGAWQYSVSSSMQGVSNLLSRVEIDDTTATLTDERGELVDACRLLSELAWLNRYFEQKSVMLKDVMPEDAEEVAAQ